MSGASSGARSEGQGEARGFLPRWAWWLLMPGLLTPVAIVAFMALAQLAHDEARCPFQQQSVQQVGDARVVEEARVCLGSTEERRFRLERGGESRVLGERRLPHDAFTGKYSWTASRNERGEVQILVDNPGHGPVIFREGTKAEHAGGPLEPPRRQ